MWMYQPGIGISPYGLHRAIGVVLVKIVVQTLAESAFNSLGDRPTAALG
jgi:hypothetical protein